MLIEHEAFRTAVKLGITILMALYSIVVVLAVIILWQSMPQLFGAPEVIPNESMITAFLVVMLPFLLSSWLVPGFIAGWRYYQLHHALQPLQEDVARLGALVGSVTSGLGYLVITLIITLLTIPLQRRWLDLLADGQMTALFSPLFINMSTVWFIPLLMLNVLISMALWTGTGAAVGALGASASRYHQKTGKFIRNPFQKPSET